jgi:hypothetical protein
MKPDLNFNPSCMHCVVVSYLFMLDYIYYCVGIHLYLTNANRILTNKIKNNAQP